MKQRTRIYYTEADRALMWERWRRVADKLRLQWSPVQVAGWLKRTYPHDETHQVSHETI